MFCNGIRLIVGLGNPGTHYSGTRHNAGACWVEWLCQEANVELTSQKKIQANYAQLTLLHTKIHVLIPKSFMNNSGFPVSRIIKLYNINPRQMLVVHDELDLPLGIARLKQGGSSGGHNGLKDIISTLQTSDFWRLRIGIGHPGLKSQVASYVLSQPSIKEREKLKEVAIQIEAICPMLISGDMQKAMQSLHSR